jgi:hypothetical protein
MQNRNLSALRTDAAAKAAALAEANELVATTLQARLAELPDELGMDWEEIATHASAQARAVNGQVQPRLSRPPRAARRAVAAPKPATKPAPKSPPKSNPKGKRLSLVVRGQIEGALRRGEKGSHVARDFGVSYPTIHLIKQRMGLVNARK